jgi:hypothetical protein
MSRVKGMYSKSFVCLHSQENRLEPEKSEKKRKFQRRSERGVIHDRRNKRMFQECVNV